MYFVNTYSPESVRLYNGTDRCSGRVEFYHDGEWGKVCSNHWSHETAEMVCKELNCGAPKNLQEKFNYGDSNRRGVTATCSGSVTSISQCTLQPYGGTCEGVSLSCAGETQRTCRCKTHAINLLFLVFKVFFERHLPPPTIENKILTSSLYRKYKISTT